MSDSPRVRLVVIDWTGCLLDFGGRMTVGVNATAPTSMLAAARQAAFVPDAIAAMAALQERGIRIVTTCEYPRAVAEVFVAVASAAGFVPDANLCGDDVPAGRPAPWLVFRAMAATDVYPPSAVVRVGDTADHIHEGHNAGTWSVGVIDGSRHLGLDEAAFLALADAEREAHRDAILSRFEDARTDAAVRTVAQLPSLLDEINEQMEMGARPGG